MGEQRKEGRIEDESRLAPAGWGYVNSAGNGSSLLFESLGFMHPLTYNTAEPKPKGGRSR